MNKKRSWGLRLSAAGVLMAGCSSGLDPSAYSVSTSDLAQSAMNAPTPEAAKSGECGKLNQASLKLDNALCPSTFGTPVVEQRTSWSLAKTPNQTTTLENPSGTPYGFTVTVTEGPTTRDLVVRGTIEITNGGELSATLWNVVANLQTKTGGNKFTTVASAFSNQSAACDDLGVARTCLGSFPPPQGAGGSLVLVDDQGNDIGGLNNVVPLPPNDCNTAVTLNFIAEFDANTLALPAGADARLEMLVTFGSAGERGGSPENVSCTLDVNCNGMIDADNPATCNVNESETNNIRTVTVRNSFVVPSNTLVCNAVTLTDLGADVGDTSCGAITPSNPSTIDEMISTSSTGTTSTFTVGGTLSCTDGACESTVDDQATLACNTESSNPLISLVIGSPASASIGFTCSGGTTPIEPGDFCTYTQGAYKATCRNQNPPAACLLLASFASTFPSGLFIGDGVFWTGPMANFGKNATFNGGPYFAAGWDSAAAVTALLQGAPGTPGVLTADLPNNPDSTSAGNLANQLVTTTLNVDFNLSGALVGDNTMTKLADLVAVGGCQIDSSGLFMPPALNGLTVRQILDLAESVVSGNPGSGLTPSEMTTALDVINQNFDNCLANWGCLQLPSP